MRTENSLKNVFWSAVTFLINLIINFVARKIFIDILGAEYNGLNSLFTSIISVLSIAELGIGTTITFFLYKPLHQKDGELIKSLMYFYKKCYRVIACVVLILGMILLPFLHLIVGEIDININIYVIYILFLLETVFSYFLSYKRSLIIADQKERITKYVHIVIILFLNIAQIMLLYFTKNYYVYVTVKILFTCLENVIISAIVDKKYPFINGETIPLPVNVKSSFIKRVRAMFYHQIGGFIVNGTDNIMISMLFGVTQVGFYNNYFMIVSAVYNLISNVFSGITASVGNLLVAKEAKESLPVYNGILGINYIVAIYVSCTFYICAQPFMEIWLGSEYLMSELMVGVLAAYLYLRIMKLTTVAFKNAAGIFYEDRFIPIIESIVNIVASLICAKFFGVAGIIMGTIISTLILYFGSYPFIVYKKVFKISPSSYFVIHLKYLILAIVIVLATAFVSNITNTQNPVFNLLKNILISTIVFMIMFGVMLRYNQNFKKIVLNIKNRLLKKERRNVK